VAHEDGAPVFGVTLACYPATLLETPDQQRDGGLRQPLELGQLRDAARTVRERVQEPGLGASDVALPAPPEQPPEEPDAFGENVRQLVDLGGGGDSRLHIGKLYF